MLVQTLINNCKSDDYKTKFISVYICFPQLMKHNVHQSSVLA